MTTNQLDDHNPLTEQVKPLVLLVPYKVLCLKKHLITSKNNLYNVL